MKVPGSHNTESRKLGVQMTSMIDVVFLLLIFFVCTASFQLPEEILPTNLLMQGSVSDAAEVPPEKDVEPIVVRVVRREGATTWNINQRQLTNLSQVHEVLNALAQLDPSLPVILDVDEAVPLGDVIDVFDIAKSVNFDKIQFAAKAN